MAKGTFVRSHYGQHDPEVCFACKLTTISFDPGGPKTHQKRGDPWEGNPVKDRIEELRAAGRRVAAVEITNPQHDSATSA